MPRKNYLVYWMLEFVFQWVQRSFDVPNNWWLRHCLNWLICLFVSDLKTQQIYVILHFYSLCFVLLYIKTTETLHPSGRYIIIWFELCNWSKVWNFEMFWNTELYLLLRCDGYWIMHFGLCLLHLYSCETENQICTLLVCTNPCVLKEKINEKMLKRYFRHTVFNKLF